MHLGLLITHQSLFNPLIEAMARRTYRAVKNKRFCLLSNGGLTLSVVVNESQGCATLWMSPGTATMLLTCRLCLSLSGQSFVNERKGNLLQPTLCTCAPASYSLHIGLSG